MFALHSRKVLVAALLATALSAPVSASDSTATTQQASIGQAATDLAAVQTSPIAQESSATVTNGRIEAPRARPKLTELRPSVSADRLRGGGARYAKAAEQPLILGIAY